MTNYDFIKSLTIEDMAEYFGVDRRPHFPSSPCYVCEYDDGLFCGNDRCNDEYKKEVYLVVSATIKYKDLLDIVDTYHTISDYKLIFTKLDETSCYGNILNIKLYSGADLSYVTHGQNVPDDIEVFDTQKVVKQLLGG